MIGVVPAVFDGVWAVMTVLVAVRIVAVWFPIMTVSPGVKFVPLMVICVPPETVPELGDTALMAGANWNV